jgi:radical SAM protein with 4Fe4S-binding SPASM domain
MEPTAFLHILKCIKPYTNYIYFHLMGEPLLNPDLKAFLALSDEQGFKVNLTTNGSLLKRVKDILLSANALRQINISLHSFEANENETSFYQYLDEVLYFVKEAAAKSGIICSLRLWNLDNKGLDANNALNHYILEKIEKSFELDFDLGVRLEETNQLKLGERVYLNMAEKFQWGEMTGEPIYTKQFCLGLRDQIGILVDGTVVPCCLDNDGNIPLGNLFEEPLEVILNSQRAKAIYDGFSKRQAVEELCKRCSYRGA